MNGHDRRLMKKYINVVAAETYLIGCAGAYHTTVIFITCNYGPAGMGTTGAVYKRGQAGSTCPDGTKKEADTGLCCA